MGTRFIDQGKTLYDFLYEFFVKCPQCSNFAYVKSFPNAEGSYLFYEKRSLICDSCGFAKSYNNTPGPVGSDYPLWLDMNCCGERLWAYNLSHLNYIKDFVSSDLREHYVNDSGMKNNTLISRLPKWIKEAKSRTEIIRCIDKMIKTIPDKYANK